MGAGCGHSCRDYCDHGRSSFERLSARAEIHEPECQGSSPRNVIDGRKRIAKSKLLEGEHLVL